MGGALLVGAAGAVVDLGHQLVDPHQAAERLAGTARQQGDELEEAAVGARHPDVEARHFERVDDLVGDVLRLDRFDQALADAAVSSVLTTVGITQATSTPLPRSSARTASLRPTTACLVAE